MKREPFPSPIQNDSSIFIGRYVADKCIMPQGAPALGRFITTTIFGNAEKYVTDEGL